MSEHHWLVSDYRSQRHEFYLYAVIDRHSNVSSPAPK